MIRPSSPFQRMRLAAPTAGGDGAQFSSNTLQQAECQIVRYSVCNCIKWLGQTDRESVLDAVQEMPKGMLTNVRLDDDFVLFRGHAEDAASAHLRGKLVACLSEPMTVKHLTLTLTGTCRVPSSLTSTPAEPNRENEFFEKTWNFLLAGNHQTLKADNYEFPFGQVLQGSLPESVEGLSDSFVAYRLKATMGRKHGKDMVIRKPLRVIRTLDPNALALAHAMSVANVWPNKLEYSISIPSKAVIYGTSVQVDFRLVPLLKGLQIGKVATQFVEVQEFSLGPDQQPLFSNSPRYTRVISTDECSVPDEPEVLDEEVEGYQFTRHIELPKTMRRCLQDVQTQGIKIRHKMKFNILLHNPDDHTSELRASLPVCLYISPSLPINENNELVDQTPVAARRAVEHDVAHQAPPMYGDHQQDQIYSDLDGDRQPDPEHSSPHHAGTGSSSSSSRHHPPHTTSSAELSLLELSLTRSSRSSSPCPAPADVPAAALRARLSSLRRSRSTRLQNQGSTHSREHSPCLSSRGSSRSRRLAGCDSGGGDESSLAPDPGLSASSLRRSPTAYPRFRSRSTTPAGRDRTHSLRNLSHVFRRASDEERVHMTGPSGTRTPAGPPADRIEDLSRTPPYSVAVPAVAHHHVSGSGLPSYSEAVADSRSGSPAPAVRGSEAEAATTTTTTTTTTPAFASSSLTTSPDPSASASASTSSVSLSPALLSVCPSCSSSSTISSSLSCQMDHTSSGGMGGRSGSKPTILPQTTPSSSSSP